MRCLEVTEWLLGRESGQEAWLEQHVATCSNCASVMRGLDRLDGVLQATLVSVPPLALQQQLSQLALEAAGPQLKPWWLRLGEFDPSRLWAQRPRLLAAQGLAAIIVSIVGWQAFGLVSTFQPVLGDVGYAMELVAASPAALSLSGIQIDLQSLGVWSLVGLVGWLVADDGLIGSRSWFRAPRP